MDHTTIKKGGEGGSPKHGAAVWDRRQRCVKYYVANGDEEVSKRDKATWGGGMVLEAAPEEQRSDKWSGRLTWAGKGNGSCQKKRTGERGSLS